MQGPNTEAMNFTPDWIPLEKVFSDLDGKPDRCGQFMFMHTNTETGLRYYKHIDTRHYLLIDANGIPAHGVGIQDAIDQVLTL